MSCLWVYSTSSLHSILSAIDPHSYLLNKRNCTSVLLTINVNEILKNFKAEELLCIKQERFLKGKTSKQRICTGML